MKIRSFWALDLPLVGVKEISIELDDCPYCKKRPSKGACDIFEDAFHFDDHLKMIASSNSVNLHELIISRFDLNSGDVNVISFRGGDPLVEKNANIVAKFLKDSDHNLDQTSVVLYTSGYDEQMLNALVMLNDDHGDLIARIDRICLTLVVPSSRSDDKGIKKVQKMVNCLSNCIEFASNDTIDLIDVIVVLLPSSSLVIMKELFETISENFSNDERLAYAKGAALSSFNLIVRPIGDVKFDVISEACKILSSDDLGFSQSIRVDQVYLNKNVMCPHCLSMHG